MLCVVSFCSADKVILQPEVTVGYPSDDIVVNVSQEVITVPDPDFHHLEKPREILRALTPNR